MAKILLFYKYVELVAPHAIMAWQRSLCERLGLSGRILIAHEGINGTVGGSDEAIDAYMRAMNEHPDFGGIDFKESAGNQTCFPGLRIKIRKEIVRLGLDTAQYTAKDGGRHLAPHEAHALIAAGGDDLVMIDTRNDYESRVGTFAGAIPANTKTFAEFPAFVDAHKDALEGKRVLMFCTGGIRCERASSYVRAQTGAAQVYQLSGGICRYVEQYPDGFFRGKNYVFDARGAIKVTDDVLAVCDQCCNAYDEYSNCVNTQCNRLIIVCPACVETYHKTCSEQCFDAVHRGAAKVRTKFVIPQL